MARRGLSFLVVVLSLCSFVMSSHLIQLDEENFESCVERTEFLIVSCEPCQDLIPELESAAESLSNRNIYLSEIDCTKDAKICSRYGVQSYPTIRIFRGLERTPARYRARQKAKQIVSHMIKQTLPLISEITTENIEEFRDFDTPFLIAYLDPSDTESLALFIQTAESPLHENFIFGTATNRSLFPSEESKERFIVLWNPLDEVPALYDGDFDVEKITKFAEEALESPLIPQFGMQKFAEYAQSGLPLALIFALTQHERTSLAQTFKPIVIKNKGKMNFATIDAVKLPFLAKPLGLDGKRWPAFVVHDIEDDETFVFDQEREIEGVGVEEFLERFWGKMEGKKERVRETEMSDAHDEL
ncbi:thioredoxin-like protein [Mollisia scopiformis]|uniref:Protein disulfide-isomerase n=1 Tax=Mollisia scopiformis TaxID=149040 RepID=A0A194X9D1_MOLSC|nr:thioredoxin-like protein [Mollisia scopiformis]KUJ16392.1 thioredoxin-like protein [Mollisia scopiformis]